MNLIMQKIRLITICLCVFCVACTNAENKNINASEIVKMIQKGKPVQLADKVIFGDLNFAEALKPEFLGGSVMCTKIQHSISFAGCVFMGNVSAKSVQNGVPIQTVFGTNLVFQNCDFRGEVNFDDAEIFGYASFHKSNFRKSASFNNITIWASNCVFSYIIADSDFVMQASRVKGTLNIANAEFKNKLKLQELIVDDNLIFNNSKCSGNADLSLMRIGGRTLFNYAEFLDNCNMLMARFNGDVEFYDTKFSKNPNFEKVIFTTISTNSQDFDLSKSILIIKQ